MILRRVLIVIGRDRAQALARLRAALARCEVDGVATTTTPPNSTAFVGKSSG